VVAEDDLGDRPVAVDAADDAGAVDGMALDELALLGGEPLLRQEDRVRERELADVVQEAGGVDEVELVL
jgi:hypothetical protein